MSEFEQLTDEIIVSLIQDHQESSTAYRNTIESQMLIIDSLEREIQCLKEELLYALRKLRNLSLNPPQWEEYSLEREAREKEKDK